MTTIFICGDSTAAKKLETKRPETGWGEKIDLFLDSSIRVKNFAINGRSTKSFLNEGILDQIEPAIQPGDFLFIQFGHNDQKREDPERGTSPFNDYQENLRKFITFAKTKKAIPVLLTSVTRRMYLDNGLLDPKAIGDYPIAMRNVASHENVILLDLFSASQNLFSHLTNETVRKMYLHGKPKEFDNYPNGIEDNTHFNPFGATIMALLVAYEISISPLDIPVQKLETIFELLR